MRSLSAQNSPPRSQQERVHQWSNEPLVLLPYVTVANTAGHFAGCVRLLFMNQNETNLNPPGFNGLYENLAKQGNQFDDLISPTNQYYAYLSKVDQISQTKKYDIYFELWTKEWLDNVSRSGDIDVEIAFPPGPVSAFHMRDQDESELLSILGLKNVNNLAEGSWYLIELEKGPTGSLVGDFYNPDIDHIPYTE